MAAGYSANPLIKKLGMKDGYNCLIVNEPEHYVDLLEEIPPRAQFSDETSDGPFDFVHLFVTELSQLEAHWKPCKNALKKTGLMWISWPKQTSPLATNLNGNDVRNFGLNGGLVDTKVCAVDHDWSGLKFMYRKADR